MPKPRRNYLPDITANLIDQNVKIAYFGYMVMGSHGQVGSKMIRVGNVRARMWVLVLPSVLILMCGMLPTSDASSQSSHQKQITNQIRGDVLQQVYSEMSENADCQNPEWCQQSKNLDTIVAFSGSILVFAAILGLARGSFG